jgi:hypothetical protein
MDGSGTNLGVVDYGLVHYGAYLKLPFGEHGCCGGGFIGGE